ncbi:cupin domain-containing protein [Actinoplanes sp. NPDC026619]|uniref:cupin domain-containing protein n=1 Tax=Actinoplanes sp. NPDC026619 TaxID=3155798 RepID=UPI00340763E0
MIHPAPATAAEPFWFLGGKARILIPGAATAGAISVMEFEDTQGHAPPLHAHDNEDEVWFVLDGEVSFYLGDDRYDLQPGAVALGPRGVPHSYLVRSPSARIAVAFAPAGIENWFKDNGSPVTSVDSGAAPFDIGAIVAAADAYRLRVVGPPPTLT